MKIDQPALLLFSGGQDSTTALYWALEHFSDVRTLGFHYGQKHANEVEIARALADEAGVSFEVLDASLISQLSINALTDDLTMDQSSETAMPNTFVPGRNLLFLTFAAIRAYEMGIEHLITGVSETDFSGYPDCRHNFILSANTTINLAMERNFTIHTPLMWRDKAEVWALADQLGVFDLVREKTLTCYNGIIATGCGKCPACELRNAGLAHYLEQRDA